MALPIWLAEPRFRRGSGSLLEGAILEVLEFVVLQYGNFNSSLRNTGTALMF